MHETQPGNVVKRLDSLYEFDREPVTSDRLCGGAYFAGSFAGEHVAATEFVIGALFVNWGATIIDIFVGLAIGNLLAVLSWALVCAPIATQTRLTLYWYLRKIGGPYFTLIYNVLNAVLFAILAGCMITVSATAVRIPFGIPSQTEWYPTDGRFVFTVLVVGAVVVWLAIAGFRRLAAFATVCSPWMLLMFVLGALVMLPVLGQSSGVGAIDSFASFWTMGEKAVWTGRTPDGGDPQISFWHITAFAWICNLAMHMGLSDMAIFRYARRASYGLFSAFGMFLGHYVAWIAAGLMGAGAAVLVDTSLTKLDSGAVATQALGISGAIAVVIAGWTTSNPTLYRAGLALQAVTPDWPRWLVTLVVGVITTIIACFPFVFTRLLDFVGLYGLLLAPPGAIVVAEHWILPRMGCTRCWAERRGLLINWPALVAWLAGMGLALGLYLTDTLHLFFLFGPVYVLTLLVYLILAPMAGARLSQSAASVDPRPADVLHADSRAPGEPPSAPPRDSAMIRTIAGVVSLAALIACCAMAIRVYAADSGVFADRLAWFKTWLIIPTLVYFVAATIWQVNRAPVNRA